jgi:DNA-binding CsgD family transcriptional regulator
LWRVERLDIDEVDVRVSPPDHSPIAETGAVSGISRDRVNTLLSSVEDLRRDSQTLIGQLRESLNRMRELRSRLAPGTPPAAGQGPADARLGVTLQLRYGLTARELEAAELLARGLSNSAIAAALGISSHTARHHTQHILRKLGVHSRSAAGARIRDLVRS